MADKTLADFDSAPSLATNTNVYVHRVGETDSERAPLGDVVRAGATTTPASGVVPKATVDGTLPRGFIPAPIMTGAAADRPAASSVPNSLYFADDDGDTLFYFSNGSAWIALYPMSSINPSLGGPFPINSVQVESAQGLSAVATGRAVTISVEDATIAIPGVMRFAQKIKPADETVNGSDTPQADDHLTITLPVGVYKFEILAHVEDHSTSAAGGFKATIGGTFVPSWMVAHAHLMDISGLAIVDALRWTAKGEIVAAASTDINVTLWVSGTVSVGTAGTFNLSWSQANLSGGSGVKVIKGSSLVVTG